MEADSPNLIVKWRSEWWSLTKKKISIAKSQNRIFQQVLVDLCIIIKI